MNKVLLTFLFIFSVSISFGQKINGQWRGYFDDFGNIGIGDNSTEYVLELEINGSSVSGSSYSYFQNRRYYVICSISGTYNKKTKSIKVTETARIKGLTPPDWSDCLQTHILTYTKEGSLEKLSGKWLTAPGQLSGCGTGATVLTRKKMDSNLSAYNKSKNSQTTPFNAPKKTTPTPEKNIVKEKTPTPSVNVKSTSKEKNNLNQAEKVKPNSEVIVSKAEKTTAPAQEIKPKENIFIEKRNTNIVKTIEIEKETFRVDLYDNGEIDGDTVSLIYNGQLLLSHKRLSDKPITLHLDVTDNNKMNELTMYAENLGSIPPNTAIMVITDGDNRYEVRIASDLQKSGTIRFIKKPK